MNELTTYLNNLKNHLEIKSVNQLAIKIGISQSTMDAIMKGKMIPKEEICEKIAVLAKVEPAYIIYLAGKSRAKGKMKNHWDKLLKGIAAATFLILFTLPSFASTETIKKESAITVYYVKSYIVISGPGTLLGFFFSPSSKQLYGFLFQSNFLNDPVVSDEL